MNFMHEAKYSLKKFFDEKSLELVMTKEEYSKILKPYFYNSTIAAFNDFFLINRLKKKDIS